MFENNIPVFKRIIDPDIVWDRIIKSSASGAPYFKKKAMLKPEVYRIVETINNGTFDETVFRMPNIIYVITQPGKDGKYKKRLVYCPPLAVTVLELTFGIEPIDYFVGNTNCGIVIGHRQMALYNLNQDLKDKNKASGDFSSYDHSLPSILIKVGFEIFKQVYDFGKNETYYSGLYDKMTEYVMFGDLFHPILGTVKRERGIASGSVFTNLMDSVVNLLSLNYAIAQSASLTGIVPLVSGDDSLLVSPHLIRGDIISRILWKEFLMDVKYPRESYYSKGIAMMDFLGSHWTTDGPERNMDRMILSAVGVKSK
jgi:hypothetical protein